MERLDLLPVPPERLEAFRAVLARRHYLLSTHTNPDPDGIASSLVLAKALSLLGIRTTLVYSGVIGRAENKALVKSTRRRFKPLREVRRGRRSGVIFLDTQPGTGNDPARLRERVVAVFDHHPLREATRGVPFWDVRPEVGATVTIVSSYALGLGMRFDRRLATAVVYALWSETAHLLREATDWDVKLYRALYPMADRQLLARIEGAKVSGLFFATLHSALERAVLYGDVLLVPLGHIPYPDVVAEVADYMLRYSGTHLVVVLGVYNHEVLFSMRCDHPGMALGELARRIAGEQGTAGGHEAVAGGQVPLHPQEDPERKEREMVKRLIQGLSLGRRKRRRFLEVIVRSGGGKKKGNGGKHSL
jgi:nanoRNase/pAp phosphatase (c-di-AMP/oligoRNAs hydrolase)